MKIIRFISQENRVCCGVINTLEDKTARLIYGDIFDEFSLSEETASIAKLLSPVFPPNIIGMGLNYAKHADETGIRHPEMPIMFLKGTNTVIGHGEPIIIPSVCREEVDYEAELAIVISKPAFNVPEEKATDYILGYCCANDVSARDWQANKQKKQWARGKSFDTFCPLGPWIVTKDEIPDPDNLRIRTILNETVLQDSNTSDMIFPVKTIISDISKSMTLLPGTVILTGTPEGVGFTRVPPVFLKPGDTVTIEIEKIGCLANPVR